MAAALIGERRAGTCRLEHALHADRLREQWQRHAALHRPHERLLARLHGDGAGAGEGEVAAFDGDAGTASHRQVDGLARRQFHFGVGADQLQSFFRLHAHFVRLRLHVQRAFAADEAQAVGLRLPAVHRRGQHADRLAAVQARVAGDGRFAARTAGQRQRLAHAPAQALAGHHADPRRCGQAQQRIAGVRHPVVARAGTALGRRALGVGVGRARHRGLHAGQQRLQGRLLGDQLGVVRLAHAFVRGQRHRLVRARRLRERLAQRLQLAQQCAGLGRLAGRAAAARVAAQPQPRGGAHRAPCVGAQFEAFPAEAAAVVVGLVDQVPQVQLRGRLRGRKLQAQLLVAVVEHQPAVASAAPFLGLHAPQRGGVAVVVRAAAGAVPGRGVAAGQVGLRAGSAVAGLGIQAGVGLGAGAAGGGGNAGFALAVVQRPQHHRTVDVPLQEAHQHFLADAWQELAAHARAGVALRHPQPGAVLRRRGRRVVLEVEPDPDPAQRVPTGSYSSRSDCPPPPCSGSCALRAWRVLKSSLSTVSRPLPSRRVAPIANTLSAASVASLRW